MEGGADIEAAHVRCGMFVFAVLQFRSSGEDHEHGYEYHVVDTTLCRYLEGDSEKRRMVRTIVLGKSALERFLFRAWIRSQQCGHVRSYRGIKIRLYRKQKPGTQNDRDNWVCGNENETELKKLGYPVDDVIELYREQDRIAAWTRPSQGEGVGDSDGESTMEMDDEMEAGAHEEEPREERGLWEQLQWSWKITIWRKNMR